MDIPWYHVLDELIKQLVFSIILLISHSFSALIFNVKCIKTFSDVSIKTSNQWHANSEQLLAKLLAACHVIYVFGLSPKLRADQHSISHQANRHDNHKFYVTRRRYMTAVRQIWIRYAYQAFERYSRLKLKNKLDILKHLCGSPTEYQSLCRSIPLFDFIKVSRALKSLLLLTIDLCYKPK